MAKIFSLGCEVAGVYRQYAAVHSELFGVSSLRRLKNALSGKGCPPYAEYRQTLVELGDRLADLENRISGCEGSDLSFRRAGELQEMMLRYSAALARVIAGLAGICAQFAQDEAAYRQLDRSGRSHFSQDKISYDYALSELEILGNKLNRLFTNF